MIVLFDSGGVLFDGAFSLWVSLNLNRKWKNKKENKEALFWYFLVAKIQFRTKDILHNLILKWKILVEI